MVDELESLRERAYGGTGAPLTPAEARRLTELEARAHPPQGAVDADVPDADPDAAQDTRTRGSRSRWWTAAAFALVAAGGIAVGSMPRLDVTPVPPDATPTASSQWQLPNGTLASRDRVTARADWDPGSLRLIAWIDGAGFWWGTLEEGVLTCMAVDDGAEDLVTCQPTDDTRRSGFTLTVDYFDPDTGLIVERAEYAFDPYGTGQLFVRRRG